MFGKVFRYRHRFAVVAGMILGLVFIASGVSKIIDTAEFYGILSQSASYLPSSLALFVAHWLPWLELGLGALLLSGISARLAAVVSVLLVSGFIFQNTWVIMNALELDSCGCLGLLEKGLQISISVRAARYTDIGMFILGLIIIFYYPGRFFNLHPWFLMNYKNIGSRKGLSNNAS